MIPSLSTLFEYLKYLYHCCETLKELPGADETDTIRQALGSEFYRPLQMNVEGLKAVPLPNLEEIE